MLLRTGTVRGPAVAVSRRTALDRMLLSYFSLLNVSMIAWKFGSSFGVGVCSLY
jgi:hypothetical protein